MPSIIEDESKPEHLPQARNEQVEAFRAEIEEWFVRYQTFYDRTNAEMRNYRLAHVDLVSSIYVSLMNVFGVDIEGVRVASNDIQALLEERREQIGGTNACIEGIDGRRGAASFAVNALINRCAAAANATLSTLLTNNFYPTFAEIQTQVSRVPIIVIDTLSRGNVLADETEIIEYLRLRFEVLELQWLNQVSQFLRWETNRFQVDGEFVTDETAECMAEGVITFMLTIITLEAELQDC